MRTVINASLAVWAGFVLRMAISQRMGEIPTASELAVAAMCMIAVLLLLRRRSQYGMQGGSSSPEVGAAGQNGKSSAPGLPLSDRILAAHGHCVYLDYNATSPIFPEVAHAMEPFLFQHFGNPSSGHAYGRPCKAALVLARERVAALLGAANPAEIVFTSCGTESDNHAIHAALAVARRRRGIAGGGGGGAPRLPHVVTTNIEHPAINACLENLKSEGVISVTYVSVDSEGLVTPEGIAAAVTDNTVLVTVMHSNNGCGSVQPIRAISQAVKAISGDIIVHTDAAQSVGKVAVKVRHEQCDLCTIVGHKFGAPKGVAALYVRHGVGVPPLLFGGGQEHGTRGGTENVMQIVGLGMAAAIAERELAHNAAHMTTTRDRLLETITREVGKERIRVNGPADAEKRLPNTLSIGIKGILAAKVLAELKDEVAASAAAACHAPDSSSSSRGDDNKVSAVIAALNVPRPFALGTLRFSTGRHTTEQEVDRAAMLVVAAVKARLK